MPVPLLECAEEEEEMICPMMSRPVVFTEEGKLYTELFEVACREDCMLFVEVRKTGEKPYWKCGLGGHL